MLRLRWRLSWWSLARKEDTFVSRLSLVLFSCVARFWITVGGEEEEVGTWEALCTDIPSWEESEAVSERSSGRAWNAGLLPAVGESIRVELRD